MPVYEYECGSCGHKFEKMQSVNSRVPRTCPSCGAKGTLKKVVSAPAFQFKGTGWYVTDYAGKGKKPAKGDEAKSSSDGGSSSEGSSTAGKTEKTDDKGKTAKKDAD